MAMNIDRSRFMDRELLDPAHVMETSQGTPQQAGMVDNSLDFLKQPVDLGTSIMAVAFDGGVVIGADSRTSTGVYISNRVSDKITKVDERVFVCRSGPAADTQAISDYVTYFLDQHRMEYGQPAKVATAASFFRELCYHNKNALMAGIIVAGWDKVKGGQVYSIPLGGALIERPFAIGGSGSTYIYGFCDAYFKPGFTREQCEEFVAKALSHAMARDGSSGGVIRMAIIDEAGVERKFIAGDKLPFGPL
jgi:20S proteasome subunit beta 1